MVKEDAGTLGNFAVSFVYVRFDLSSFVENVIIMISKIFVTLSEIDSEL